MSTQGWSSRQLVGLNPRSRGCESHSLRQLTSAAARKVAASGMPGTVLSLVMAQDHHRQIWCVKHLGPITMQSPPRDPSQCRGCSRSRESQLMVTICSPPPYISTPLPPSHEARDGSDIDLLFGCVLCVKRCTATATSGAAQAVPSRPSSNFSVGRDLPYEGVERAILVATARALDGVRRVLRNRKPKLCGS